MAGTAAVASCEVCFFFGQMTVFLLPGFLLIPTSKSVTSRFGSSTHCRNWDEHEHHLNGSDNGYTMIYHDIGSFKMDSQMIHRSIFRQIHMNLIEGDMLFFLNFT